MLRSYIENTSLTSVTTTATIFKRALSLFVPIPLAVLTQNMGETRSAAGEEEIYE